MTADNTTAFDSLDARAQAQGSTLDRISLRDHVVKVEIGAFQVERGMTQRVSFDVVVEVMPPQQPLGDDVDRILSYDVLVQGHRNRTGGRAAEPVGNPCRAYRGSYPGRTPGGLRISAHSKAGPWARCFGGRDRAP